MTEELSPSALRVQEALAAAGITCRVVELPASTRSAREAAAAIGCKVEEIAKSIVFRRAGSGEPVLVIASGTRRIDEARVARLLGVEIEKADADFVRETTGFAIGGVPPIGHLRPIETLIDVGLLEYPEVWAAAGTPHAVFSLTPRQLVEITGGRVEEVGA